MDAKNVDAHSSAGIQPTDPRKKDQMQTPTPMKAASGKNFQSARHAQNRRRVTPTPPRTTKAKKPSNGEAAIASPPATTSKPASRYSVGMFSPGEARCDRWQDLAHAAQTLVAQSASGSSTKETLATVEALLEPLSVLETFRAYPGEAMMSALKDALARETTPAFRESPTRIAKAIITGSYRRSANAWKVGEEEEKEGNDRLMKDYFATGDLTKPYFEVLIVSDDPTPEQVRQGRTELRQLRRPEDPFVYEAVTVPSFEDGVLGGAECRCAGGGDQGQLPLQIPIRRASPAHLSASSIFLWNPARWSRRITEWLSPGLFGRSVPSWTFI